MSVRFFFNNAGTRDIKALKVKCDNLTNGCDWTGELGSLETHLQSCDYALLPCTNQCKTDNEVRKFYRKHLERHLANDCPRRQYKCPHCQETGEHQERTTIHLETCPGVKVHCPNNDCQDMVARCDVEAHQSTCAYESVSCKYAAVGCEEKPLRKHLKKHEENDQLHLQVTVEKVLDHTKRIALLESSVQTARDAHKEEIMKEKSASPCTLKLNNYKQYKNDNKVFYSPPFYTSYSGYKMCLSVYVNGWGDGAGTHVSVHACLMKGDHDDTLTWPFPGSVTIELLNQLEDRNHHKSTVTFPADDDVSERVVDSETGTGWGWPEFISHPHLDYNPRAKTQYLKDNTLVFRVSVEAPNHKPWLECTV